MLLFFQLNFLLCTAAGAEFYQLTKIRFLRFQDANGRDAGPAL